MLKHKHLSRRDPVKRRRELDLDNARRRSIRRENPEAVREKDREVYYSRSANWLKRSRIRKYNLTPVEWDAIFFAQGQRCANPGCRSKDPGNKHGTWHTDHDHVSGKVRGILCQPCNTMLGHAKDDPFRLLGGAKYLEERSGGPSAGSEA